VPAIKELYLSLREVEAYICEFEEKYNISSADFLCNDNPHIQVSEDDAFQWEAFIAQRRELQSLDRQTHRNYLSTLGHRPRKMRRPANFEQACFAA
jgi:hypothetical protein